MTARSLVLLLPLFASACFVDRIYDDIPLERVWGRAQSPSFAACVFATPQIYDAISEPTMLVAAGDGVVLALDPLSGAELWRVSMPAPDGEAPMIVASPVRVAERLVVAYHTVGAGEARTLDTEPLRHRVAVVDLANRRLDPAFAPLEIAIDKPVSGGETVSFAPARQLARGQLVSLPPRRGSAASLGTAYVSYGSHARTQPWHGWLLELDLDAWLASGTASAISGVLLTTPEADCDAVGADANTRCGGGFDGGAGPLVLPGSDDGRGDDARLLVAVSNGELDLARSRYANALLRLRRGVELSYACEPSLCAGSEATDPKERCLESCIDVHLPRLLPGQSPPRPPSVDCTGLSLLACLGRLDLAPAVTPVAIEARGRQAIVWPTPDGHVSLLGTDKLGTLYDRARVADDCGASGDACSDVSAGTIAAQPALSTLEGWPLVVVSTFMPDKTHAAGLSALVVVERDDGSLGFTTLWRSADVEASLLAAAGSTTAPLRFRQRPTRAVIGTARDASVAWIVDIGAAESGRGNLLAMRLRDGRIVVEQPLGQGAGVASAAPLVQDETVTVSSCVDGKGHLERYRVTLP